MLLESKMLYVSADSSIEEYALSQYASVLSNPLRNRFYGAFMIVGRESGVKWLKVMEGILSRGLSKKELVDVILDNFGLCEQVILVINQQMALEVESINDLAILIDSFKTATHGGQAYIGARELIREIEHIKEVQGE